MISNLSFRKKLALELFRKIRTNSKKIHQLNYIFWECTLKCNMNCIHCGSDCKKDTSQPEMPVEDFIAAIDTLKGIIEPNQTQIVFTGGEPLLRKDLEKCGQLLYQRGFPWGMVTNGLALTRSRLNSLLNAGLRVITVSLDGLELSHNWLRNHALAFNKTIESIQFIANTPSLRFDVVTCVNSRNFSELQQLMDLLIELKVKEWRIFTIFPTGRAAKNDELQLNSVQFKQLFDFISKTRKQNIIKLNYGCEGFLANYETEVRDNMFFCRAGINIASILSDGSIGACPSIRNSFIQGNIYSDNLKSVWENGFHQHRNRNWMKNGICSDCSFFRYCDGNGMHLRNENTNEIAFCHYKRICEGEKIEISTK